ncbi:multidrug resistance-associated ABC transporter [Mycena olivaceomarginata]|nr:multidrug resistance-associated ABC transporter [Mycena olivaceomarginata]
METIGLFVRTRIIGSVFRKSLRLSARAWVEHTVGQTATIISTDSVRLDRFCTVGHNIWTSPIQIIVGVGLLINNLGYSALVGLGVLLLGFPLQIVLFGVMFKQRKKGITITDMRVRLSNEVLQSIRLIKYYAWEGFYMHQIGALRECENRDCADGFVLASILSFITYALSGHELNIAIIFSSLQFFNIIRMPLVFIPFVLSAPSGAMVSFARISAFLTAKSSPIQNAVDVDASFAWETAGEVGERKFGASGKGSGGLKKGKAKGKNGKMGGELPMTNDKTASGATTPREEEKPFELRDLKFSVPKGVFVAIVGKVGSGKSSILQGLIGEMRRTAGTVVFGGTMSYVPQTAWIRNATLRQNIIFGQEENEEKSSVHATWSAISKSCLTERKPRQIGERGINVSGGQKARISLARAAYSDTDILLLDDTRSAVDSFVGKAILEDCILRGPLADRTRILVTHALHVLDKTDYIYIMDNGTIKEQGTYETLMKEGFVFSKLMEEYGSLDAEESASTSKAEKAPIVADDQAEIDAKKGQAALTQTEERNTGAVTFETYGKYLRHAGGLFWGPIILLLLALSQASQVGTNLFLGFWTSSSIHGFRQGDYMAVYAGLGFAQAFFTFLTTFAFACPRKLIGQSESLQDRFVPRLRSPSSFFDTTPMGRILSRLVKDQDTLDSQLSMTLMQLLTTLASVIGTVGLILYTFPLLGVIFPPMAILYYLVSIYYRRSSESAIQSAEHGLDLENRAYFMTITLQLWPGLRLDLFGTSSSWVSVSSPPDYPSKIGIVMSYTLGTQMVAFFAQNEQNMNSVERLVTYAELPAEGAATTPEDPPSSWPDRKSSILQALFRMVELQSGEITIDGHNIRNVGLDVLRSRLALVPQDSVLFLGTLRENLDPQASKTDAELVSVLQRAWLLPREGDAPDPTADSKFSLDSTIGDEGIAGEKQLLALCRALVKNSPIIVLDEATSSVDVETDAKLQRTIRTEFAASTLLCIAHRLNTIAYYDRILVMDQGEVAEFDTVLNLYGREESIFRLLCNEADLHRVDILQIRAENAVE